MFACPRTTRLFLAAGSLAWVCCAEPSYGVPDAAPDAATPAPAQRDGSVAAQTDADVGVAAPAAADAAPAAADAGVRAAPDAGPAVSAPKVLAAWAAPLLGRYATRAFTFAQDDLPTVTRAEDVYLTEFAFDEATGRITLRSKLCQSVAQSTLGATLRLVDATQVPERLAQVVLSEADHRFSTEGLATTVGYTREPPASCTDKLNQSVPKAPVQTWIAGNTCRCLSAEAEPVVNDCRVLDPDGDNKPAFTYLLHAPPLGDTQLYVASESASRYIDGRISADGKRHDASVLPGERPFQLDCAPAGCGDIGKLATYCPPSFNPARFVRVEPSASCQSILSGLSTLFPDAAPPLIERCY